MTWKEKLKKVWDENPLACVAVGALAVTAVAKFIDASSAAKGRSAYARQIDHKITMQGGR